MKVIYRVTIFLCVLSMGGGATEKEDKAVRALLDSERHAVSIAQTTLGDAVKKLCRERGLAFEVRDDCVLIYRSTFKKMPLATIIQKLGNKPLGIYSIAGKQEEGSLAFSVAGYRVRDTGRGFSESERTKFLSMVASPNEHLVEVDCFCTFEPSYVIAAESKDPSVYFLVGSTHWLTVVDGKVVDDSHFTNLRKFLKKIK